MLKLADKDIKTYYKWIPNDQKDKLREMEVIKNAKQTSKAKTYNGRDVFTRWE